MVVVVVVVVVVAVVVIVVVVMTILSTVIVAVVLVVMVVGRVATVVNCRDGGGCGRTRSRNRRLNADNYITLACRQASIVMGAISMKSNTLCT